MVYRNQEQIYAIEGELNPEISLSSSIDLHHIKLAYNMYINVTIDSMQKKSM
jgi:hypothetical protein